MLRTGKEHLELLRDGRVVYIGSERVDDVTRHPAFRNAAATVAALYDMKADPANREAMSYEEDGGRHSIYFLRPRTREDLQRRMLGHRRIADLTFGMFGRCCRRRRRAIRNSTTGRIFPYRHCGWCGKRMTALLFRA